MADTRSFEHRDLSDAQIATISEAMRKLPGSLLAKLETHDPVWVIGDASSDPKKKQYPPIIPQFRDKATGEITVKPDGIEFTLPPAPGAYMALDADFVYTREEGKLPLFLRFNTKKLCDLSAEEKTRFADYVQALTVMDTFFSVDLATILVNNLDKHGYFTAKQTAQLQKLSTDKAIAKATDWISDESYKSIFQLNLAKHDRKLFMPHVEGKSRNAELAFQYGGEVYKDILDNNPDLAFRKFQIAGPTGTEIPITEFKHLHNTNSIWCVTMRVMRLNYSSSYTTTSVTTALLKVQLINNGEPYMHPNQDAEDAPVDVFGLLDNPKDTAAVDLNEVLGPVEKARKRLKTSK
jgi:hypothetical protein